MKLNCDILILKIECAQKLKALTEHNSGKIIKVLTNVHSIITIEIISSIVCSSTMAILLQVDVQPCILLDQLVMFYMVT